MKPDLGDVRPVRILVLGAYGLIGAAVCRRLLQDGFQVRGLGRNAAVANRVLPDLPWVFHDLKYLVDAQDWLPLLTDTDLVVNCAGALQQSSSDDLECVHNHAVAALATACANSNTGLIQISAAGVGRSGASQFMTTKLAGDTAIAQAGINYWIFRPGLILAPTAYGGSALLRMLAAIPLVQPLALPQAPIQTVSIGDVGHAVSLAARGVIPSGTELDLVEEESHELREVVASLRNWLGFPRARTEIELPGWLLAVTSSTADLLGHFGWRSPLRSTAIDVLKCGVCGDPAPWNRMSKQFEFAPISDLRASLTDMPAMMEDRLAARMGLMAPLTFAILFFFWLASGVIGLINMDKAATILTDAGWSKDLSRASVVIWSLVDITLALMLIVRKWAGFACWAMISTSLIYLLSSTLFVPHLWADPLGPLVKIIPAILLALFARILLETR